jgi:peptidoglycan/xylan/chitin deacetylase (PgdA/CDA1 family)
MNHASLLFRLLTLFLILLLAGTASVSIAEQSPPAPTSRPTMLFTLRVDDLFNRGSPLRPRTISALLDTAEKHHYRVILNVIPRRLIESPNENGDMVKELRSALDRGHEIIQHGYDHCCSQCGDSGHQTYCPLLQREQPIEGMLRDIRLGKEILEAAIGRKVFCYGPTGVDLHTTQLLTVVKQLGYISTTGQETPDHIRLGLKVVTTGEDYAFGAKTPEDFAAALKDLKTEFDDEVKKMRATKKDGYFQILLHDPFTRPTYQDGATLKYLETMLQYMESKAQSEGFELKNVLSRDVLGLTDEDLKLPEPKYPDLFKRAKELNRMQAELLTTQPSSPSSPSTQPSGK